MVAEGVVTQIGLVVADLAESCSFYLEALGGEELYRDDSCAVVRFGGLLVCLMIEREGRALLAPEPLGEPGGRRTIVTVEVDDVEATAERLTQLGVRVLNGPAERPWGSRSVTFCDPDGYVWEAAQAS